jgi:DHA3 family tetracycline resistance protein-like MFS transporter
MSRRVSDPARVYVRVMGTVEGLEWGFWLAASVWWIVVLELSPLQLVAMGAVLELSVLIAETPTGVVADLVSRRRSILISQVLMGVAYIWAVASFNYWVILPAQALFGVGWTFRSGADTAWVTDELKGMGRGDDAEIERLLVRKHRFGILVALGSLSTTMLVGTVTSVRTVAVLLGVVAIAMGGYLRLVMREDHFTPGREQERGFLETLRAGLNVVVTRPRLRVLVGVIVVLDMGSEAFDRLGHKFFLDNGGWGDDSLIGLGVLFLVLAVAGLGVNALAARALETGSGVARLASLLLLVAAVGATITMSTTMLVFIGVGLMLQDSTREALWPVLEGWANRDAPSEVRATVHSLMGQVTAMGELIGGIALGALAQATSVRLVLAVAAALWFVAAGLATRGIRR